MWPFKKKVKIIANAADDLAATSFYEAFTKMNEQILTSFAKSNEATSMNSKSIISLAQSLGATIKEMNAINERLTALEEQLSVTKVTFHKGGD